MRGVAAALAAIVGVAGCASASSAPILDLSDPRGDVRLSHPDHPEIREGTFDLERLTLARRGDEWELVATFASPVTRIENLRLFEDIAIDILPQTIDVYLDIYPDTGRLDALPGRGFHVPASEAWDTVLVVSSIDDLSDNDLVRPTRISAHGRSITAIFPGWALPESEAIRGSLVTILATSPRGEGRVRQPTRSLGNCQVWNDDRCTLDGDDEGPAVLDATMPVERRRPIALTYGPGQRPASVPVPVVFARGGLLSAAPVDTKRVAEGDLATVLDAAGVAIATAIVLSIVGDTASLKVVGDQSVRAATGVVLPGVPGSPPPDKVD